MMKKRKEAQEEKIKPNKTPLQLGSLHSRLNMLKRKKKIQENLLCTQKYKYNEKKNRSFPLDGKPLPIPKFLEEKTKFNYVNTKPPEIES